MALILTSPAFANNGAIPKQYSCEGTDISPPLQWSGAPQGTKSFALIIDDPDAPDPRAPKMTWVHWVVYDIPQFGREWRWTHCTPVRRREDSCTGDTALEEHVGNHPRVKGARRVLRSIPPAIAAAHKNVPAAASSHTTAAATRVARGTTSSRTCRPRRSRVPASPVELKLQSDRDGFGAEIAVQHRFAHFAPPTGLLVATERQCPVTDVVAIDPDGSSLYLRRQQVCLTDVTSPDTSREPIDAVIRLSNQILIHVLERHRGHDGAEDLLLNDLHVRASID